MTKISKKRLAVLHELERIVSSACYNSNIQNWGPNGQFNGEGRGFRYPITFTKDGEKLKGSWWVDDLSPGEQMSGRYAFGANELHIMRALEDVVRHLEERHGLKL